MRYTIRVSKALLARADVEYIALVADSLIPRFRDKILRDGGLAAALARIAAQLVYRIASERYRDSGKEIRFQMELADWEWESLSAHRRDIIREIESTIDYYRGIYDRARCRRCVAGRIAALTVFKEIVEQIVRGDTRTSAAELALEPA